ncbi:hypothetical protein [Solirubrobacter soli]|uniref:hypothetical protein n=1 Tax=Solirubrobacter soli TaxID=363832 RepID=UPI00040E2605|nr:hypothetical protein [Solirubrobacter soli]
MASYFITIPITLTDEQREVVEAAGWRVSADLKADVMAAAVPTTTIEVESDSPEQAVEAVAQAFGVDPEEARVEER